MIPKIIHQIWYQGQDQIPNKYQTLCNSWKKNHPCSQGWQYILWDQKSMRLFVKNFYPDLLPTYRRFKYMHQYIDFFKYIVLYHMGGVYADMDTNSLKPIDGLLYYGNQAEVVVSKSACNQIEALFLVGHSTMVNNGVILAQSKSHFLQKLIEEIVKISQPANLLVWNQISKIQCIENTTGPKKFTEVCLPLVDQTSQAKQNNKQTYVYVKLLPSKFLEPCYGLDTSCQVSTEAYVNHKHEQSWINPFQKNLIQSYYCFKNNIIQFSFILLLIMTYLFIKFYQKK